MQIERGTVPKGETTLVTSVRFLSRVDAHVLLQVTFVVEASAAEVTAEACRVLL